MSQHRVDTFVEGTLTDLFVSLEGTEIGLSRNGDTFRSSDTLNIDGPLNLTFQARGIAFAAWQINITLDGGSEPLFKRSGFLSIDNESLLKEAIPLPAGAVASAKKARRKSAKKRAGKKGARKSSRDSSRKRASKR